MKGYKFLIKEELIIFVIVNLFCMAVSGFWIFIITIPLYITVRILLLPLDLMFNDLSREDFENE